MSRPALLAGLVAALFFGSGATALAYQVAWLRELALIFGSSFEAVSIVLATFMAGQALGGFALGRRAAHVARPLRVYGWLEIGIGAFALLLPALLAAVNDVYVDLAQRLGGTDLGLQGLRVGLASALLLVPTACMGGTLPLLVELRVVRADELGGRLAGLYAINTLGAVFGTLVAGFVLLPALGVWGTELCAALTNLAIGFAALGVDRLVAPRAAPPPRRARPEAALSGLSSVRDATPARLAFLGTAVAGMVGLALEVLWTRGISVVTGQTTYSFSVMLATFLVGIASGSALHAWLARRPGQESARFGAALLGVGLTSLLASMLIPRLPELAVRANQLLYSQAAGARPFLTLVASALVMLPSCVFLGMAFPLAGEARARLRTRYGESAGDLLALNTLGAIAGSLLAGFALLPRFGLQRSLLFASCCASAYGVLVLGSWVWARGRPPRAAGAAAATALLMLLTLVSYAAVPAWDHRRLQVFTNNLTQQFVGPEGEVLSEALLRDMRFLAYREGRVATVSVLENPLGTRSVHIDGKVVASDAPEDLSHELLLGHVPVLLHAAPRSALVIGFGAGVTLGSVASHAELERIALVEIEPAVLEAAEHFEHVNGGVVHDPRLRIHYQDGRNHLLTSPARYDVITADPIHPWARGAAYLYTREYFALAASRLAPGGVMCQWLPLYELSPASVRSVVGAFAAAFERVQLWQSFDDVVLVGSQTPLALDPQQLRERLAREPVASGLSRVGFAEPLDLLAELTLTTEEVRAWVAGATLNTDDNLYLEFASPHTLGLATTWQNIDRIEAARRGGALQRLGDWLAEDGPREQALERLRANRGAKRELRALRRRPLDHAPQIQRAIDAAKGVARRVPDYGRVHFELARLWTRAAEVAHAAGDRDAFVQGLVRAAEHAPQSATARFRAGNALLAAGRADRASEALRAALQLQPSHARARRDLARALLMQGDLAGAREQLAESVRRFGDAESHYWLARVHQESGAIAAAVGDYERALHAEPDSVNALNDLAWILATDPLRRDGPRAVRLAQRARALAAEDDFYVEDTLAAARAAVGEFERAVAHAERAAALARAQGVSELAADIAARRAAYARGVAYSDPSLAGRER